MNDLVRPGKITFAHLVSLGSRLTDRDRQIALDCYEHHVLTTEHLTRLHFNGLRTVHARLEVLYQLRILDRFRPTWQLGSGSTPYHWILDAAGAHVVAAQYGIERRRLRWRHSDALGVAHSGKLHHHIEINEFFARLAQDARAERGALREWYGERTTHEILDGVAPDGYGVLTLPGRPPVHLLLELDRATEPARRLREKALRYAKAISRGALADCAPVVILAVPTATRAKLAAEAVAGTAAPITVAEWSSASPASPLAIVTDAADQLAARRSASPRDASPRRESCHPSTRAAPRCQTLEITGRVWSDRREQPCAMRAVHTEPQAWSLADPRRSRAAHP